MDRLIAHFVREALERADMQDINIQPIINEDVHQIWLRDDRTGVGARWCTIDVKGSDLIVHNGRGTSAKIDLTDPNSINTLSEQIKLALITTTLFINYDE